MPRINNFEGSKLNSSKYQMPTYFKDAAELLTSRILRQIHKSFYIIKNFADCKPEINV